MGRYLRPGTHPLIVEAERLWSALHTMSVYPERFPHYLWQRLDRAQQRAEGRMHRRMAKFGTKPTQRKGRADTKDRPYAVGGRGKRGW